MAKQVALFQPNSIEAWINLSHSIAREKGFWDSGRNVGELLMLIVSEAGEALEAHRKGDMENFEEEVADIAIRLFDLCGGLGIDLQGAMWAKTKVNMKREHLHGKDY